MSQAPTSASSAVLGMLVSFGPMACADFVGLVMCWPITIHEKFAWLCMYGPGDELTRELRCHSLSNNPFA